MVMTDRLLPSFDPDTKTRSRLSPPAVQHIIDVVARFHCFSIRHRICLNWVDLPEPGAPVSQSTCSLLPPDDDTNRKTLLCCLSARLYLGSVHSSETRGFEGLRVPVNNLSSVSLRKGLKATLCLRFSLVVSPRRCNH
jgi:hypothetical protein